MIAVLLLGFLFRFPDHHGMGIDPVERAPPNQAGLDPRSGPIVVTVEYLVAPADAPAFTALMAKRKSNLRRDGARRWSLLQDLERPNRWIERFQRPTWGDCIRHHQRVTTADLEVEQAVSALLQDGVPPKTTYLVARRTDASAQVTGTVLGEPALPAVD